MKAEQQWQVVKGVCETDGGEGVDVYGVQVTCPDGSCWRFADVTDSADEAERLADLLQQSCPHPCHWQDVVEDYIAALSMG